MFRAQARGGGCSYPRLCFHPRVYYHEQMLIYFTILEIVLYSSLGFVKNIIVSFVTSRILTIPEIYKIVL